MRNLVCFFLLSGLAARGLENGVVLQERTGQTQQDRPTSISVWFAQGEFAPGRCAQPRLNGAPIDQWQCDPKVWWRDRLSPEIPITAVINPSSKSCTNVAPCPTPYVRVQAYGHGFLDGERVTILHAPEGSPLAASFTVIDRDEDGFSLAGLGDAPTGLTGLTVVGPANGSLRHAVISFRATLEGGQDHKIDFAESPGFCHLGDRATCAAAALDRDQMLAFNESRPGAGDGWGFAMDTGAAGILQAGQGPASVRVSARKMLQDWDGIETPSRIRYWLRGPVVTQVIVEDRSAGEVPQYDFGWRYPASTGLSLAAGPISAAQTTIPITKNGAATWDFTRPFVVHIRRSTSINEMVRVCGIDTSNSGYDLLQVCTDGAGGRGYYRTTPTAWSQVFGVSAIQALSPTELNRQLHPMFILTFYPGWRGVKADYILENASVSRYGGAWISWTLLAGGQLDRVKFKSGVPVRAYASSPAEEFWMNSASRMRKTFWDGEDPDFYCNGGDGQDPCVSGTRAMRVRIDHNAAYKIYARLLPPIDLSQPLPAGSSLDPELEAFNNGDKGEIGASRNYPAAGFPATNWRILGLANYNNVWASPKNGSYPNRDMPSGDQEEGGILTRRLAKFVATWGVSDAGWEMIFGTSVPGGGGLAAVSAHWPVHFRETDARPGAAGRGLQPFTTAAPGAAFGRPVSIDARPTIYFNRIDSWGRTEDRPRYACGANGNNAPWCSPLSSMDGITLDQSHQHLYANIAYAITGDYFWLEELHFYASINLFWKNPDMASGSGKQPPISAMRRAHWGYFAPRDLIRQLTWPLLSLLEAAAMTPNEPQFGETSMPDLHYYHNKLARNIQIEEGRFGIKDGAFPWVNPSCEGVATLTTNDPSCWGFLDQSRGLKNDLPLFALGDGPTNSRAVELAYNELRASGGSYQTAYYYAVLDRMEGYGYSYATPLFARLARFGLGRVLNKYTNPYQIASYREPVMVKEDTCAINCEEGNPIIQTFKELGEKFVEPYKSYSSFAQFGPNRELIGNGYVNYWRAGLALIERFNDNTSHGCTPEDVPPDGCTGAAAWRWITANMRFQDRLASEPKWNFIPRHQISVDSVTPGATEVALAYSAPTKDACSYRLASEPVERQDRGGALRRQLTLRGLAPGQTYNLRLTCGTRNSRVSGTTRKSLTFTTRAAQQ